MSALTQSHPSSHSVPTGPLIDGIQPENPSLNGGVVPSSTESKVKDVEKPMVASTEQGEEMKKVEQAGSRNGEVVMGEMDHDGRVVLYIIKADETSYINYIKPIILATELQFPHVLSCIDTKTQWAYNIHPERMVPALKDKDPVTGEDIIVFEGTGCLQYLADRFDTEGIWSGRTAKERGEVFAWTAYQTAGIGATAKYWLYFLRGYPSRANPEPLPKTIKKLHENTVRQWDILEKRLSLPQQEYIALKDRPTLADLSYFPFAMPWMFTFLGVDIKDWPRIQAWSEKMLARPAVKEVMERAPKFGHDS